ncbi:MAG: hypothetical protein DRI57_14275 [Deltaproteobacteria bacterium]|nr:MAG: hypothetical protein DRI57_14275 [Deltaproteobacteria bacterium]
MKILVTGAGGLIGSYVVQALHHANHEVTGLYRKAPDHKKNYPWTFTEADLTEDKSRSILEKVAPNAIVHCAAVLPKQFGGEEAEQVAEINQRIDEQIIRFCTDIGCDLIYTSSTSIYGLTGFPWNEMSEVSPIGPYAVAKFKTEQRILTLKNRSVILRISSPYAPEQRSGTVLRIFIERAIANRDLYYYGTGERQQDFTAAEDVAQAILCSIFHSDINGVFNISSGNPISMRDLAELILQCVMGTKSRILPSGQPDPQESYRALFDISKAKNILKWQPSVSLEDGIKRWIRYLEKE